MINRLEYDIEKRAEQAESLSFCNGIKLLSIKKTIAAMLKTIGTNEIFEQYTVHDISHINKMLKIAEWLIPETTKTKMTSAEWLMLTLSIYLLWVRVNSLFTGLFPLSAVCCCANRRCNT